MTKALVINLYGGPGSGKSTTAAWLYYKLKSLGHNVELASEYAKDKIWEESFKVLNNQIYVIAHQHHRLKRLLDKVDIIITDSPILLGLAYDTESNKYLEDLIFFEYSKMNNMDFYIRRPNDFKSEGRRHNEIESNLLDKRIIKFLKKSKVKCKNIYTNDKSYNKLLNKVLKKIK